MSLKQRGHAIFFYVQCLSFLMDQVAVEGWARAILLTISKFREK